MLKIYILVVVMGLVGGVVYGGWYYYKDTQARIQTLTENSARLEVATQQQNQTIQTLVDDAEKFSELNRELNSQLEAANEYKNVLIDKLQKHDLVRLSIQKPGLVEAAINNGTKELFDSLEELTTFESNPIPASD
jgi:Na+-transporting NADH:ubiquinone oxidoreductase subunit NqrC